jgi:hypothetical protein
MRDLLWFIILPLLYLYAAIFSKLLPPSGIPLLEAIAAGREKRDPFLFFLFLLLDRHYVLIIPLVVPICTGFIFVNWVALKHFRSN